MGKPLSRTPNERQQYGHEAELVAAALRRAQAHVSLDRHRHHRSGGEAQARPGDARRDRGGADPRRSRHRRGGKNRRGGGRGPLRQVDHARGGEGGGRRRGREGDGTGGDAACARPSNRQAVRGAGGRRQRLRQDHHHRQARRAAPCRGPLGDARRRRHFPRGGDRPAQDLGRAHRRHRDRTGARLRCGRARVRRGHRGARRGDRCAPDRHRRPAAEQGGADGRAREDGAGDEEGRPDGAARRAAGARRHRRAERALPGRGVPRSPASPAWS